MYFLNSNKDYIFIFLTLMVHLNIINPFFSSTTLRNMQNSYFFPHVTYEKAENTNKLGNLFLGP